MKFSNSLKKEVRKFSEENFPEIHSLGKKRVTLLIKRINSKRNSLLTAALTFFILLCSGLVTGPSFLQYRIISNDKASLIIDQRISNIATIFSITMVVVGWLITNISSKEAISLQLMFKKTYFYPIFYYIIGLVGSLMIFSFLREVHWLNFGNILITATVLIVIALGFITTLFAKLAKVVDHNFLYDALEVEVMTELYNKSKNIIISRKSANIYKQTCESLLLTDGIGFNTNLTKHQSIKLHTETKSSPNNEDILDSIPDWKYQIADINLEKMRKKLASLNIQHGSYYIPVAIGCPIATSHSLFFLYNSPTIPQEKSSQIVASFKLAKYKPQKSSEASYQQYLNDRFLKDTKDGKIENVKSALEIYSKIFQFENKLYSQC